MENNKKHVMIDIETLGRNAGCVVLSIGAVEFLPEVRMDELVDADGNARIGNVWVSSFYEEIEILPQLLEGAEIEPETLDWWRHQSEAAKQSLMSQKAKPMSVSLLNLQDFLLKGIEKSELVVWSQGTDFDISILRALYTQYFGPDSEPWRHTNIRDARTFLFTMGSLLGSDDPYHFIPKAKNIVPHSASDDAVRSAYNVAYLNTLYHERFGAAEK